VRVSLICAIIISFMLFTVFPLVYVPSPYRPESFEGIIKNKLPGKLFFPDPSEVPL